MKDHLLALVALTALLFVATVLVFFRVYHDLYIPEPARPQSEQERFEHFAVQHDLSLREREVLRLIFDQKTNAEIAGALNISQNTVKFHVRNLMQKTGCKNRKELFAEYLQS
ncbi:MAG: helix-turn-helix transcriptional regulator [Eubacterium sp.]|nr:helix-turn-helix transcriptional regulator [Eubacterium sp.]